MPDKSVIAFSSTLGELSHRTIQGDVGDRTLLLRADPNLSEVEFKIKHLVISTVNGRFGVFDSTMRFSENDFSDSLIQFTCDVSSINTGVAERDTHLLSADFFDSERYPSMTFVSTGIKKTRGSNYNLYGLMTIRGVTKPLELFCVFNGSDINADGRSTYNFDITGTIRRSEYGLVCQSYDSLCQTYHSIGNKTIGEEVRVSISVHMVEME